jgi:hypothetical protein
MTDINIKKVDSLSHNDIAATKIINDNFQAIKRALENSLSRKSSEVNYMDTDIDMNSKKVINVGDPVEDRDIVNKKYVDIKAGNAAKYSNAAEIAAKSAESNATRAQLANKSCQNAVTESKKIFEDISKQGLISAGRTKYTPKMTYVTFMPEDWVSEVLEDGNTYYTNTITLSIKDILEIYDVGLVTVFVNFLEDMALDHTLSRYARVYKDNDGKDLRIKIFKKYNIPEKEVLAYLTIFMELRSVRVWS